MTVKVKICGITRLEDGLLSAQRGADFLGYIFYPPSKRYVTPEIAGSVIHAVRESYPEVQHVGVFVNVERELIQEIHQLAPIDLAQLHGEEVPQLCNDLRELGIGSIKTVGIGCDGPRLDYREYSADYFLCDTYDSKLKGGTGRTFDPEKLPAGMPKNRLFLAGGLTSENVGDMISAVHPFAIDVSSGVEESPGIKDAEKLKKFFDSVDLCRTIAE